MSPVLDPNRLDDDLDEIAASIPRIPRSYSTLRSLLALLPAPLAARTQGSFPVDEVVAPESAVDQVGVNTGIGSIPGSAIMDGTVGSGQLRDGAVTGAAFASTIRPVYLVTALPGLPNALYPVGQFVYKTNDVPPRLYKNVADVWVAAIGPSDIQADSITAGQIAAGAISTSELAVGARLTGEVANESGLTPGVFIDSTGILIRSGKLTLQDEFGTTAMSASGFAGTWSDFLALGLYNAAFGAGSTGNLALGRTAALPYWTLARDNDGATLTYDNVGGAIHNRAADATYPSGFRVRTTWTAITDNAYFISDRVPIIAGFNYPISVFAAINRAAGTVNIESEIRFFDKDANLISESPLWVAVFSASQAAGWIDLGTIEAVSITTPGNARSVQIIVRCFESTTHSASNRVDLGAVAFGPGIAESAFFFAHGADFDLLSVAGETAISLGSTEYFQVIGGNVLFSSTTDVLEIPKYGSNTWHTYTPTVGGSGGATHSTAEGRYMKLGKIVFINIYLVCNGNGSGAADITITTPSNPDRNARQVLSGSITGHGITNGPISLSAFTGGAGAVWDRIHSNAGAAMSGADYDSGGILTLQGWYMEA